MRKLVLPILVSLALLAGAVGSPTASQAHHNGPWLPGDITSWPAQHRMIETGVSRYCFDSTAASYPNFRSQAAEVASYATGVGSLPAVEVAWNDRCDVRNTMPSDAEFLRICGTGAAACIVYWTDPVTIYYRRGLIYNDWKSGQCHEGSANTGHLMGLHEQYDDIRFVSRGSTWTCMDFGTFVWKMSEWDRDRVWNAFVPDRPSLVSFITPGNGYRYVTWNNTRYDAGSARANGIASNSNATRVSFAWSPTPDVAGARWIGDDCGPAYDYCFTPYSVGNRGFPEWWGGGTGCFWMRAENSAFWWVPQMSAPSYWTLAGCYGPTYDSVTSILSQWWGDRIGDATCVTWHESRFRFDVDSPTEDRGLFQVNRIHERSGFLASLGRTWADMLDPWHNAATARFLFNDARGWRPWTTRGLCGL